MQTSVKSRSTRGERPGPTPGERQGTGRALSPLQREQWSTSPGRLHDVHRCGDTTMAERWYSTEHLADLLGIDPSSLRRWRPALPLQGPPFVRLSARKTIYSATDVAQWLRARRTDPSTAA